MEAGSKARGPNVVVVMRTLLLAVVFFGVSLAAAPAQTPSPSPSPSPAVSAVPSPAATNLSEFARGRIDTMLRTGHADAAWFSGVFLAQVPASQIDAIIAQLKTALGAYKSIDGTRGDYTARFERGTDEVLVHLDADNKIDGLFFRPPKMQSASLDGALRALRPPRGTLSYVIIEGRSERAALNASAQLAVGSTFKLAALAAIRDEIARGRRHWSDVIPLEARWKSLPSGILRTWPDGIPLTLSTYAAEMISISDNTAADAMVRLAGRAALAPYAGRNQPFLTTREMFTLKSRAAASPRAAYLAARTPDARATVLRRIAAIPLRVDEDLITDPIVDIEWHYTVRELCGLMRRVADLPLMSINPGVADRADFRRVAYKGGSDFGAINLTTQVTTKRGRTLCVSATINDRERATDDKTFEAAYAGVLVALAKL